MLRSAGGKSLEGIPVHGVGGGNLVDRKIALEHAARGPELGDAGLDVRPPAVRQLGGRRRLRATVEAKAGDAHAKPAELDDDIRAGGELEHGPLPRREGVRLPTPVGPNPQRTSDVVEDDRLPRKGACERRQVGNLRVVEPGVERQAESAEHGKTGAKIGVIAVKVARWISVAVANGAGRIPAGG